MKLATTKHRAGTVILITVVVCGGGRLASQDEKAGKGDGATEIARAKQEQARDRLKSLEATMERLARLLGATEPQNAQKLRMAFHESRERLLREGMESVVEFIKERKLDRALESQSKLSGDLDELLNILLEKDIDPRELIRHIKRLKGVLEDIDTVVKEETAEKIASDQATEARSPLDDASEAVARLDDLVREQKAIESKAGDAAKAGESGDPAKAGKAGEQLGELAKDQDSLRKKTEDFEKKLASTAALDERALASAKASMGAASESMRGGKGGQASKSASEARKSLESARAKAEKRLDELREKRDFATMKKAQDDTAGRTESILERMKKTPPLTFSPEGGVPGRGDIGDAKSSMESASENLAGGRSKSASRSQDEALTKLGEGRRKVEETLEALQRALRERLLAYLRERFTHMLDKQRKITRETFSLDAKLRALAVARLTTAGENAGEAEIDRRDLQRAEELSRREARLATIAEDVIDLLEEDGTTLVFPRIVGELRIDLENVEGLLAKVSTGALTQRIQKEIEATLREILEAIKQAQRSPPPPNPNSGRQSQSGAGPLLPTSSELKMIRSMQKRLNDRTHDFDLDRTPAELNLEEQRQARKLADRQKDIEDLFRKIARALAGG